MGRPVRISTHGDGEATEHVQRGHPLLLGLRRRGVQKRALGGRGFGIGVDLFGQGDEGAPDGVISAAGDGDDGGVPFGGLLSVAAVVLYCYAEVLKENVLIG